MICEIVTTGTELLLGEILNTNVQYLSQILNKYGFDVLYHTTVGDNYRRMQSCLELAAKRADVIIISGGLGPTRGDITKDVVAEMLQKKLVLDQESKERIDAFFAARNQVATANNYQQALLPEGAVAILNDVGTAPGVWLEAKGKLFILLPGPPHELVHMVEHHLLAKLKERFPGLGMIVSRTLHIRGAGESSVAEKLDKLIMAQGNPTLALYARNGEILLRLTAKAINAEEAQALIAPVEAEVRAILGSLIYGADEISLASALGRILEEKGMDIAFAESCTGGLATSMMTDVPGSSCYVKGSIVAYSNETKISLLGVKEATLASYSAISEETAREMAEGVRMALGTSMGVGITGNAGPGPSEDKPVGLVYIAVTDGKTTTARELHFTSTRENNKLRIATTAISMALDRVLDLR